MKRPVRPKSAPLRRLGRDDLQPLVAQGLSFLADDPARLGPFFETTGLEPIGLRVAAAAPGFASSLLDYFASDETLLRAFAAAYGYDPADLDALRLELAGTAGSA